QYMAQHFEQKATIELLEIDQLPVFNKPENYTVLPEVQKLVDKIEAADGVVIATPEYDHSPTDDFNNALACFSYSIYIFVYIHFITTYYNYIPRIGFIWLLSIC